MPAAKPMPKGKRTGSLECEEAIWLAVWIVNTVVAPELPGVTVDGVNCQVDPGGKPVPDIVTSWLYAPPTGGTPMLTATEPPETTVNGLGGAVTV